MGRPDLRCRHSEMASICSSMLSRLAAGAPVEEFLGPTSVEFDACTSPGRILPENTRPRSRCDARSI